MHAPMLVFHMHGLCQRPLAFHAQCFYSLGGVDVHAEDEYALRWACGNGHLLVHVVQWLHGLGGMNNVHARNDEAFRLA